MQVPKTNQLHEAMLLCSIHEERMRFAWGKIEFLFPLTSETYEGLQPEMLSFFDQLIFRFSKLQDSMGGKLFPALLENLGEEVRGKSFIDILNKLEELELLSNSSDWLLLRETRNIVTHEYPHAKEEIINGLNLLGSHQQLVLEIWQHLRNNIDTRFGI